MILATNITKEDFKRAYTNCLKEAWIFHNQTNFNQAVQWKQAQVLTYNLNSEVESEDDFETNASAIDLFQTFQEIYEKNDQEQLKQWEALWENVNGFEVVDYEGDAIVDGNLVGDYARDYFLKKLDELNLLRKEQKTAVSFEHLSFKEALVKTQAQIARDPELKYLFEAAFSTDDQKLRTRCDILELKPNKHVNLYEVKATSKFKKEHFFDVVYQVYVLQANGFIVDEIFLMTLNPNYVYGFDREVDLRTASKALYEQFADLTYEEVLVDIQENNLLAPFTNEAEADLDGELIFDFHDEWKKVSLRELYDLLDQEFGIETLFVDLAKSLALENEAALHLLKKTTCQSPIALKTVKKEPHFVARNLDEELWCYHVLPYYDQTKETVFNLPGSSSFTKNMKAGIFYKTNNIYLETIDHLESLQLTKKNHQDLFRPEHYRIFDVFKKSLHQELGPKDLLDVNHLPALKATLQNFFTEQEIYMYDFETAKWALPRFWKTKVYQQIPFQYSVDIIFNDQYDYYNPQTMHHHDFLSSKMIDPRPDFIVNFINDMLVKHHKGVYVAYNKSFEQTVLKYLAFQFPKYAKPLIYIASHTIDLMDFFKGKSGTDAETKRPWFLVYHPDFHGSYSIKKTQPALDPNFSYDDLIINKGTKASQTFRQYLDGDLNQTIWDQHIRQTMIDYCNRDTLAMVVILKQVQTLLKNYEQEAQHG